MTHDTCEDLLGQLSDYIDGDLDPELCHALETHMAGCENCRTVVDTLSETVHLYRALPPATVSATLSARLRTALGLAPVSVTAPLPDAPEPADDAPVE